MNTKKYQLGEYRKFLLSRLTVNSQFTEFVEKCLTSEDEAAKHSFHKIMVHHWGENTNDLFDGLSEYIGTPFIPVNYISHAGSGITTFYTNNLNVILKITKIDFMFPFRRNMYNIDVLFNDKTSADAFGHRITLDEIVSGVVSRRFNEKFELDLSNFCNDPEFTDKNIQFYKISLLAIFKILMIRMGRDTKVLHLNDNNLKTIPQEIMNFFIKGELTAVNLSNNNIQDMSEVRLLSRIERLWLEGNPLCDNENLMSYVKNITSRCPRIKELDGIEINRYGLTYPFWKNYIVNCDRKTKMLIEKFLTLYFTLFDANPRKRTYNFYHPDAKLTLCTNFTDAEEEAMPHYGKHARNTLQPVKRRYVVFGNRIYFRRDVVLQVLLTFPETTHDPKSFNVDVIKNDSRRIIVVVDGIYKERNYQINAPDRFFQFRRTFVLESQDVKAVGTAYFIKNEMFNIMFASQEQIDNSFKIPSRNLDSLCLLNPDKDEIDMIMAVFTHISNLKRQEAELRLRIHNWDLRKAISSFSDEVQHNKISEDRFIDNDLSDLSSLCDDDDID